MYSMTSQLVRSLAVLIAASFLFGSHAVAWTVPSSPGKSQIIEIKNTKKYKVVRRNTHICLCQGGNYCSCNVGHIAPQ
jgi:hypothetical protein